MLYVDGLRPYIRPCNRSKFSQLSKFEELIYEDNEEKGSSLTFTYTFRDAMEVEFASQPPYTHKQLTHEIDLLKSCQKY